MGWFTKDEPKKEEKKKKEEATKEPMKKPDGLGEALDNLKKRVKSRHDRIMDI